MEPDEGLSLLPGTRPTGVEVRLLPAGEEIVLRPRGRLRFLVAAFLAFWLCGWAVGEVVVLLVLLGPLAAPLAQGLRELLPGPLSRLPVPGGWPPLPVLAFLALWFVLWTFGGVTAAWQLLRILAGSDRYLLTSGGFSLRRGVGPFGRSRAFGRPEVTGIVDDRRRSHLAALVSGKEVLLSVGLPADVSGWLAHRLREAAGVLPPPAPLDASHDAGEPPVPEDWVAAPADGGGVVLAAPPSRSRKTSGCALTVAALVTLGLVALLLAAGPRDAGRNAGGLVVATLLALFVVAVCLWAAFARESWRFRSGSIERTWRFGPLVRRREVRDGTLVLTATTDSDGDDWFDLTARGAGGALRVARRMNAGPDVFAFARYAARQSGFALDVTPEAREALRG